MSDRKMDMGRRLSDGSEKEYSNIMKQAPVKPVPKSGPKVPLQYDGRNGNGTGDPVLILTVRTVFTHADSLKPLFFHTLYHSGVVVVRETFKVKKLHKSRYPPFEPIKRPEWNSDFTNLSADGEQLAFRPREHCKTTEVEIPTPDYTCFLATRYKRLSDGRSVPDGEVVVCREKYKLAPWCYGPKYTVKVKTCHIWGTGSSKSRVETLPNEYRLSYVDGACEVRDSDRFYPLEPGTVFKTQDPSRQGNARAIADHPDGVKIYYGKVMSKDGELKNNDKPGFYLIT